VRLDYDVYGTQRSYSSWLPAAAEMIKLFISSVQHLILDVDIDLRPSAFSGSINVDFSPLSILGAASLSIPRIDLYVHTGLLPPAITRAQLLSSLGDNEDIVRSIKEGVLIIHAEKTAPDL
jgi:hypothetical protein